MLENKTYNYIYKTRNIFNGKEYIGVHKTNKLNDGYIGCGVYSQNHAKNIQKNNNSVFVKAVLKHGYDNFIKEVLQFFDTYEEALEVEKSKVNMEYIKRKDTYNTALGGMGGLNIASIKSFELVDSNGNIYEGENIREFCRQKNLNYSSIVKLLLGKQQVSQGFYLKNNIPENILVFDLIENIVYQTCDLHTWCKNNIPESIVKTNTGTSNMLLRVLTKYTSLYNNRWWCCYEKDYKGYIEIDPSSIQNGFMYTISFDNEVFTFTSVANFIKNSGLTHHGFNLLEKELVENYKGYELVSKEWLFKDIEQKEVKGLPLYKKAEVKKTRKGVSLSEEHKKAIGNANKGKKHPPKSQETRNKISEAKKGTLTEWTCKEVIDTATSIIYKSLKIACKELGFSKYATIKGYLSGNRPNKTTLLYTVIFNN